MHLLQRRMILLIYHRLGTPDLAVVGDAPTKEFFAGAAVEQQNASRILAEDVEGACEHATTYDLPESLHRAASAVLYDIDDVLILSLIILSSVQIQDRVVEERSEIRNCLLSAVMSDGVSHGRMQ